MDFQIGLMTTIVMMKTIMKAAILIMALVASTILKIGTIIVRYLHIHLRFDITILILPILHYQVDIINFICIINLIGLVFYVLLI